MRAKISLPILFALALAGLFLGAAPGSADQAVELPDPALAPPSSKTSGQQTAVFAGGCFWGVQAVFQHVNGVISATSGYSGGDAGSAHYEIVSEGHSGHAEAVRVVYDPAKISYGQLLKVFFSVAHDPTQLNRQGPDSGTQYRSAIFTTSPEQEKTARAYVAQLDRAKAFPARIVTQINPLNAFYRAEDYHQDYLRLHPDQPYIVFNDLPKLAQLKRQFPGLYRPPAAN